jgi:phage recombination protein Bet
MSEPRSLVAVSDPLAITDDELRVIKETLNPDLTSPELRLFALVAKRSGLDPFAKQIFAVKRNNRVTFQTSQEGYLSIAERTGQYDGCDEPVYGPPTGIPPHPEWATVRVYRKGMTKGVAATAFWNEYFPGEKQGMMWLKMPRVMLAKVARVAALRLAFPYVYADLYSEDEMAQAGQPARSIADRPEVIEGAVVEHPAEVQPPNTPPTEPWLDIADVTVTGVVSFGNQYTDGNLRETPDGHIFGFKLALEDGRKIPQVIATNALALAAASEASLANQTVTAHGDIWRVPWDKDGQPMPPYQRLVLTRLETPTWTIPAPAEQEPPALASADQAELDALPWPES